LIIKESTLSLDRSINKSSKTSPTILASDRMILMPRLGELLSMVKEVLMLVVLSEKA
jgi:hypothetical protein